MQLQKMSIFNDHCFCKLRGRIKKREDTNFGYFAMEDHEVAEEVNSIVRIVRENIQIKNIDARIRICQFEEYEGNY